MFRISVLLGLLFVIQGASATEVATLFDSAYVDVAREGANIVASVNSATDLSAVTHSSLSDWVSALSSSQAALVPDLDYGYIQSYVTASQVSSIMSFVQNGGILVSATDSSRRNHYFLNKVFGWSVTRKSNYYSSYNPPRQAASEGTCFAEDQGSPATLKYQSYYTTFTDSNSLPSGSTALYSDGSRQVSVWSVEVGAGKVYMLAYDWKSGANANWDWVLHTALSCGVSGTHAPQTTLPPSTPPPGCEWAELGAFSGSSLPSPVSALSGAVSMRFTSDASTAGDGAGFLAVYGPTSEPAASTCSADSTPITLENVYGVISDGPGAYGNNAECTWIIAPANASGVSLVFESFNLENYYDKLRVYECEDKACLDKVELPDSPFTGTSIPAAQTSAKKFLQIVLDTDSSVAREGFRLLYAGSQFSLSQSITYCGDEGATLLTQDVGFISTDSAYSASEECEWEFDVGAQGLSLIFLEFQTELGAGFVSVNGLQCASSSSTTPEQDKLMTTTASQTTTVVFSSSSTTAAADIDTSTPAPSTATTTTDAPQSTGSTPSAADPSTSSSSKPEPTTSEQAVTSSTTEAEEPATSSVSESTSAIDTTTASDDASTTAAAPNATSPVMSPIETSASFHSTTAASAVQTTSPATTSVAALLDSALANANDGAKMVQRLSTDASVTATAYTSIAEWVAALSTSSTALIPELVSASPLTAEHATAVRDFVENGGTLVSASDDHGSNHAFLNSVFGWTTDNRYWTMGDWKGGVRMPGAAGTCFAAAKGSPAMLSDPTYVTYSDERDLPSGAAILYSDGGLYRQVSVWGMEVGAGDVYMLAYDWSSGAQESWDWVLHTALTCASDATAATTSAAATTTTTSTSAVVEVTTTATAADMPAQTPAPAAAPNATAQIETSAPFQTSAKPTTSVPSFDAPTPAGSYIETTAAATPPLPTRRRTLALAAPSAPAIPMAFAARSSAVPSLSEKTSVLPSSIMLSVAGLVVLVLGVSIHARRRSTPQDGLDHTFPRSLCPDASEPLAAVVQAGESLC